MIRSPTSNTPWWERARPPFGQARETTVTTGLGPYILDVPVLGYASLCDIIGDDPFEYLVWNEIGVFERGIGLLIIKGGMKRVMRELVIKPINWPAGLKVIEPIRVINLGHGWIPEEEL